MEYMDAKQAAAYLGVKVSTVYAYVSRGLLDSVRAPDHPRRRRYRKSDLDRLKKKSEAHAGESAAASGALRWGAPSLDTAVSEITPAGPSYRGRSSRSLVREAVSFEAAAELLWTGTLPEDQPDWFGSDTSPGGMSPDSSIDKQRLEKLAPDARPIDRMRLALMLAEMTDATRFGSGREAKLDCARRIVVTLAAALIQHEEPSGGRSGDSIATLLASSLRDEGAHTPAVFDVALVSIADHELNASTFATRVVASTGAGLYASVAAGLAAATGPRHGGACDRSEVLIDEVLRSESARTTLLGRVQRGESIPGFGHPLYPHGDPRWKMVVSRLGAAVDPKVLDAVDALVAEAERMRLGKPTVDLTLGTLCRALGLPNGTASALFALGRVAGWIAHALEQQEQGFLLRPRAHYVGP